MLGAKKGGNGAVQTLRGGEGGAESAAHKCLHSSTEAPGVSHPPKCDFFFFPRKKIRMLGRGGGAWGGARRCRCRGTEQPPPPPRRRLSLEALIALVIGHREGSELRHAQIIMEISPHSHGSELAPNHPCRAAFLPFYYYYLFFFFFPLLGKPQVDP